MYSIVLNWVIYSILEFQLFKDCIMEFCPHNSELWGPFWGPDNSRTAAVLRRTSWYSSRFFREVLIITFTWLLPDFLHMCMAVCVRLCVYTFDWHIIHEFYTKWHDLVGWKFHQCDWLKQMSNRQPWSEICCRKEGPHNSWKNWYEDYEDMRSS